MKKAFVALTLLMFVGSVSATVYASSNKTPVSIVKHDEKKGKKKKSKKGSCSSEKSGGTCCQKKAA